MMGDVSEAPSIPRIIIEGCDLDTAAAALATAFRSAGTAHSGAPETGPALVLDRDALVNWLQEQAEDDGLDVAMAKGSLSDGPATALMAELIRRARSAGE